MEKTLEQRAGELIARLDSLFEGDDSLPKTIDRVKALQKEITDLKALDPAKIAAEVDRIKAGQETLIKQIRFSKRGLHVPGLEDEQGFSMMRACLAIKTDNWKEAGREKEIMDACRAKASQAIGNDTAGGYFVPDQVIPEVIGAIYTRSVFVSLQGEGQTRVSVLEGLTGGNVKIPKFNGGLVAYWIGEEDEYAESLTSVGDVTLNPKKMGVLVRLTDSMQRLSGFGFEKLLRTDLIRAAAKKLDWTIAFGRGTNNMPRGITRHQGIKIFRAEDKTVLTPTEAAAVADWDGGDVSFDTLMDMDLALEEDDIDMDDTFATISSPRFFHKLKKMKIDIETSGSGDDPDQQPYLLGAPFIADARLREIIGEYDKSNQFPSNALPGASIDGTTDSTNEKYSTIVKGNLGNVVLGRWGGIEITDDGGKGKGFTSDHTYIKLRLYADVAIREERGIIVCPDAKVRA